MQGLPIGIQDCECPTPCAFVYSCFRWIRSDSVSVYLNMGVDSLMVGGTKVGVIVLFGCGETLRPVSLLCGHSRRVTDIMLAIEPDKFFSVSEDGRLVVWSTMDYTCIAVHTRVCSFGDIRLRECSWNLNWVVVFSVGKCATIYDMREGRVFARVVIPGLVDFAAVGENSFVSISTTGTAHWKLDEVDGVFLLSDSKEEDFDIGVRKVVSCAGVISIGRQEICVGEGDHGMVMDFGEIFENDDEIKDIIWAKGNRCGVVSKLGVCLEFDVDLNGQTWRIVHQYHPETAEWYLTHTYSALNGFVLHNKKQEVLIVGNGRQLKFVPFGTDNMVICPNDPWIRQTEQEKAVDVKTGEVFETPGIKISTIAARRSKMRTESRTVMTGGVDGSMHIFQYGFSAKRLDVLVCPVHAFVFIMLNDTNENILIIGVDGSCSLFTRAASLIPLKTRMMRIDAVYFVRSNGAFILESEDMSLIGYQSTNGEIARSSCVLPAGAQVIWRRIWFPSEVNQVNVGNVNGMFVTYRIFDINSLFEAEMEEEQLNLLNDITQPTEYADCNHSIVLIGSHGVKTFSYPGFSLSGKILYQLSPGTLVRHLVVHRIIELKRSGHCEHAYLFKELLESNNIQFEFSDCLPELLKLFVVAKPFIKSLCARICIDFVHDLSAAWVQRNTSPLLHLTLEAMTVDQLFLLACVVVRHPQFVPATYRKGLLEFLLKLVNRQDPAMVLADFLLIEALDEWSNIAERERIIEQILNGVLVNQSTDVLMPFLARAINRNPQSYYDVIKQVIVHTLERKDSVHLSRQMSFLAGMSKYLDEPTRITLILVSLSADQAIFKCIPLLDELILSHCTKYHSISQCDDLLLFGMSNGFVHLFIKNIERFAAQVFDGPIDFVSISPDCSAAVICSSACHQMATLSIDAKKSRFTKPKVQIVSKSTLPDIQPAQMLINWSDPAHPSVEPAPSPNV